MPTQYAVLVDVGTDCPEVVFVGDHSEAMAVARSVPDDIGTEIAALVSVEEAIREARDKEVEV